VSARQASHTGKVMDGPPAADEGFSTCTNLRGVCEFMEHLAETTVRSVDQPRVWSRPSHRRVNGAAESGYGQRSQASGVVGAQGCCLISVCILAGKP
jgi:hypothetical protein